MGLFDSLKRLLGMGSDGGDVRRLAHVYGIAELARRLDTSEEELRMARAVYHPFTIPKRSGGTRNILAPDKPLKALQRRILRRLLRRLPSHVAAKGFTRGQSIVSNARVHARKAVVVRMDLKNFFESTSAQRVERYFRLI